MDKTKVIVNKCNNIVIHNGCLENVQLSNFLLTLVLDCDFDTTNSSDIFFLLDEGADNNFNFSFEKDYDAKTVKLTISGDKNQNFKIKGVTING
jgi:hypothetical protein